MTGKKTVFSRAGAVNHVRGDRRHATLEHMYVYLLSQSRSNQIYQTTTKIHIEPLNSSVILQLINLKTIWRITDIAEYI